MKKLIFFVFFTLLFACDKSSIQKAYNDYYKYQQEYISAILDNNKQQEINSLKKLIECGDFLKIDVNKYKAKLKKLLQNHKTQNNKVKTNKTKNNKTQIKSKTVKSKYIKVISYNPIKIKTPTTKIKVSTIKNKNNYKKVFDIPNAIVAKFVKKNFNGITLRIAQFNKKTVRVVLSSNKKFKVNYQVKNNILTININSRSISNSKKVVPIVQKPKVYKRNKVIVIDPGHGGKDSGGVGLNKRYEKIAVLKISKYLKDYLTKKGYTVYLTRDKDIFIPLKKRTHFANLKKADLFISIHCNIAPKKYKNLYGIETYYLSPTRNERAIAVARIENKEVKGLNYLDQRVILKFLNKDRIISSHKLAIDVQQNMLSSLRKKYTKIRDNGVRPGPFWVLVGTQMPSILIEAGYLTHPLESKRLFNPNYQKILAKGIAKGIEEYFRKNP